MTTPTPTPAEVEAALDRLAQGNHAAIMEWSASVDTDLAELETWLNTIRAALKPPAPAEVEAALAVIQDAEGVTWTSGVDTDAIRAALATIRAALAERAAKIARLREAWQGAKRSIAYEAELAEEDGHTMRANAYHHAIAIIESKFVAALSDTATEGEG